jgi:hypothetical protein
MKKGTQAALSFAAGYLVLRIGIAIYHHPVGSAVVFAIIITVSAFGGTSASEAAHGAVALAVVYALVFVIAAGWSRRWHTAAVGFIALMIGAEAANGLIDYVAKLAASDFLLDHHWWTYRDGWWPSHFWIALLIVGVVGNIIREVFWPHPATKARPAKKHSPPQYEEVRSVAEVLSRINSALIETHFGVSAGAAAEFMKRLVEDGLYCDVQADGWHYPAVNGGQESYRSDASDEAGPTPRAHADAEPSDQQSRRVVELEEEVRALKARINRLRDAGKSVIRQREAWSARALAAEGNVAGLAAQLSKRQAQDDRFDSLRRLIAKELHPDFCTGSDIEKAVRAEFFKRVWHKVEEIGA